MRSIAIVLLLAGAANAQEPVSAPPSGQKASGFALEAHVGTQLVAVAGVANLGLFGGGFFAGYKLDRVIFGLGFDISRVAQSMGQQGVNSSMAGTEFFFTPGLRVAIVRSQDQRVEMFGQFDLGLGGVINEQSPSPMGPQPDVLRFRLNYNIGPGVRFWVHPQFAIGAVTGVHGDFAYTKTTDPGATFYTSQSTTVTSIFAALQLLGVF
jgi:hypothetical protein